MTTALRRRSQRKWERRLYPLFRQQAEAMQRLDNRLLLVLQMQEQLLFPLQGIPSPDALATARHQELVLQMQELIQLQLEALSSLRPPVEEQLLGSLTSPSTSAS